MKWFRNIIASDYLHVNKAHKVSSQLWTQVFQRLEGFDKHYEQFNHFVMQIYNKLNFLIINEHFL